MIAQHKKRILGMSIAQVAILSVLGALLLVLALAGGGYLIYASGGMPGAQPAPISTTLHLVAGPTSADPTATVLSYPTLPPEWTATLTPEATATLPPTATPVPSETLSPTYAPSATHTPKPTPSHVPTARNTAAPVNTATQVQAAPTSSTWSSQGVLTGNGNGQTQHLNFGPGQVRVDWNYAGSPSGGTLSPADEAYHQQTLALLKSSYDYDMAYYQSQLNDAAAQRDALAIFHIQQQMQARTNQYNSDVAAENARYAAEKAAATGVDNTTFKFWASRDSSNTPLYLDGGTGPGSGTAYFQAAGGSDYYFSVQASGPWTLNTYYRP